MAPPFQSLRLRSIERWLRELGDDQVDSVGISSRAAQIDAQMIEEFDVRTSELLYTMMRRGDWGYEGPLAEFRMAELSIWREILDEFLPRRA